MKQNKNVRVWTPAAAWALLILVLSIMPGEIIPDVEVAHSDKIAHFLIYTVLAVLMVRGYYYWSSNNIAPKIILFMLILGGGYGILMELVQRYVPGREPSLLDAASNLGGVFAGLILGKGVRWQK
ncbi:MAG: VanZ family protein [Candidatus Omnitrophota bacterium]